MKQINVRVSSVLEDVVYHNDKPYLLEQISFVREPQHNCQMIVYATMIPLEAPVLHLTPSFIDDLEAQLNPDVLYCDLCGKELPCDCLSNGESVYG